MTSRFAGLLAMLLVAVLPAASRGTTITFQDAAGADNSDIPLTYGSNISGNATGFVTTDGTGATPDIALSWSPSPNYWEYHTSSVWSALGSPVHVAQLDTAQGGQDQGTIAFSVGTGVALQLLSLDIGNASDQTEATYSWTIDVVRSSDSQVVTTQSTGLLGPSSTQTVSFNFTGDVGEDYALRFTPSASGRFRTAIDNVSFAQAVPEPSTNLMLVLGAAAVGFFRLRKRTG